MGNLLKALHGSAISVRIRSNCKNQSSCCARPADLSWSECDKCHSGKIPNRSKKKYK